MARQKPHGVKYDAVSLPISIAEHFNSVMLVADVMFVCGLPFLVTISRGLEFVTAQFVPCRTAAELGSDLKSVLHVYCCANIHVAMIIMDGEFKKIRQHKVAELAEINTMGKNKHVGEIERKYAS